MPTPFKAKELPIISALDAKGISFPEPFYWTSPVLDALEALSPGYGIGPFDSSAQEVQRQFPDGPWLVAEGDSWFNHPLINTIVDWLRITFKYGTFRSDKPGKTLTEMLDRRAYLEPLLDHRRDKVKAVILSGGGNDLIGWKRPSGGHSPIFKQGTPNSPASFLNTAELDIALSTLTDLLSRFAASVNGAKPGLPILTHCYDSIIPRKGNWIFNSYVYPQLVQVGATDPALQRTITALLQDRWQSSYKKVCAEEGMHYIDLKGITKTVARWFDEIHPRSEPFREMAAKFDKKLREVIKTKKTKAGGRKVAAAAGR